MTTESPLLKRYIHPIIPIQTGMAPDLSNMRHFSAILLDVYGTILISRAGDIGSNRHPKDYVNGLGKLLKRHGIDQSPGRISDMLNRAIENAHALSRGQQIDYPEVDIVQIWQQVLDWDDRHEVKGFALEYELIVNPVYPMPGVENLLLACKARQIPMGIISNAQFYTVSVLQHILRSTLEKRGFDHRLLYYSWREGYAKPSTVMFSRAQKRLFKMGIPAASVLYVGNDMRNDMLPAKAVGFQTCLFAGDRKSLRLRRLDRSCRNLSPDLIITDLRQLITGTGKRQPGGYNAKISR